MRPFDLEAALRGEPVVTRDGRLAADFHLFNSNNTYRLLCVIGQRIKQYTEDGKNFDDEASDSDLFMPEKPKKKITIMKYIDIEGRFYKGCVVEFTSEVKLDQEAWKEISRYEVEVDDETV